MWYPLLNSEKGCKGTFCSLMNRKLTPVRCLDFYEEDYQTCIEDCDNTDCDQKCQEDLDEKILKYGDATTTDPSGSIL